MLTELIAANQNENGNGNGNGDGRRGRGRARARGGARGRARPARRPASTSTEDEVYSGPDPGAARRFRFRHPTASGKTIAAAGFVEAARTLGVLILTHRRLLVSQFNRDLTTEGYGERFSDGDPARADAAARRTRSRSRRTRGSRATSTTISRDAYQLVIADEAHTALGEKTSQAIRSFPEPIYIGMTATEQLIAKQVSDVFPASVDDLPLADAARRGLIAPLRCLPRAAGRGDQLRCRSSAATSRSARWRGPRPPGAQPGRRDASTATASTTRRASSTRPASTTRTTSRRSSARSGIKAEAVSGRTPPVKLAETLAAYERGEINVLINAMLLAEGWNSPRATVCMHLAPTASRRVYQQRIGRIMRMHPRKEAGIVVDFVPKGATHNERVVSLHSLLDADFYREGARVTPAPRRRIQRRAQRKLTPAPWLVPVTPDVTAPPRA